MNKQFCNYSISLKLKELGFDEPCLGIYCQHGTLKDIGLFTIRNPNEISKRESFKLICKAPLYQQVIDWFREKHDLHISIESYNQDEDGNNINYEYTFCVVTNKKYPQTLATYYSSYHVAREEAILMCIETILKHEIKLNM